MKNGRALASNSPSTCQQKFGPNYSSICILLTSVFSSVGLQPDWVHVKAQQLFDDINVCDTFASVPRSRHLQMDNIPQSIIIKVVTSDPAEPYSLSRRFLKVERLITISLRISRKSQMTSYSYPWWKCVSISTRTSLALGAILCLWTFNQKMSALRFLPSPSVVALWLFCLRCRLFLFEFCLFFSCVARFFYLRCRFFIYVVTFFTCVVAFLFAFSVFFNLRCGFFLLALWLFYLCSVFFLFALWLFYLCCGFFYLRCGICICICICEKHIISTFVDPKPICSLLANAVFFQNEFSGQCY